MIGKKIKFRDVERCKVDESTYARTYMQLYIRVFVEAWKLGGARGACIGGGMFVEGMKAGEG